MDVPPNPSAPSASAESPTSIQYQQRRPILVLRTALLRVVSGPDCGASCALKLKRLRVGSAADNDLVLSDPLVSRHHLELWVRDSGYQLRDLDSTNGTFYRGAQIHLADLGPGAELRLGGTVLRVERGEEESLSISAQRAFGSLIGSSPPMQEVFGLLAAVAPTDTTVLIQGETGTGKELVAEELHRQSARADRPFVIVDCGSIPQNLIEAELFGHVKGAFTGALTDRAGAFEKAAGGTIFLDELGELPLEMQTRLLRVLDKRTIKRVGSHETREVDIRVVAATNRDLAQLVTEKLFRQDLFFRLSVVVVRLPPLRERPEDIPLLARHLLWQVGCQDPTTVLTPKVLEVLASRQWPGNVRELRNVIERAAILSDGAPLAELYTAPPRPAIGASAAADPAAAATPEPEIAPEAALSWLERAMPRALLERPYKVAKELLLYQFEQLYLQRLLAVHGLNIKQMAKDAGVDRHLIRDLLQKHGLGREEPQ